MCASKRKFKSIEDYIGASPRSVRGILQELRQTIKRAAPEAEETISYQMPAFKLNGILVWFAAFKNHIGFYPKVSAVEAFEEKLVGFKVSKGTIQFPLKEPIPYDLVAEIVKFRVQENSSKIKQRSNKGSC